MVAMSEKLTSIESVLENRYQPNSDFKVPENHHDFVLRTHFYAELIL